MAKSSFDPQIDLSDDGLFGNEVAEDATEQEFRSYYYERRETGKFSGLSDRLLIVKAYKGEGKSALLRRSTFKIKEFKSNLVIERKGHQISPNIQSDDYGEWVREWKRIILNNFAYEIGSQIGFAWTDDSISLVEESEKHGFKEKGLLISILNRFGIKYSAGGFKLSLETPGISDIKQTEKILQRWNDKKILLWLLVDDIDKNFENTPKNKIKIASFFDAIRDLHALFQNLYVRATIRPNVWTIISREYESLSHIRQYLMDLCWTPTEIEHMIYWRIRGYIQRKGLWGRVSADLKGTDEEKMRRIIGLVFQDPMRWGDAHKPPSQIISTLSKKRPRWAIELVKAGSLSALQNSHKKIVIEDILLFLDLFGRNRIHDIVAEFISQCPAIEDLIVLFRQANEEFDTDGILKFLNLKIQKIENFTISGVIGKPTSRDVANFLFEIGFINGKKYQDSGYEHFSYADRPYFFKSLTTEEGDLWWEIHPCYRQALEIRGADGRHRPMAKQPGR